MTLEPLTTERRRQQTREYLLDAAAQVFAQRGFHGASLDQVAAAAGFTKGAVYSNFKNKDELFLALIEAAYRREMTALKETIGESEVPAVARLGDFVGLIRDELAQMPDNWASLYLEFTVYAMRNPAARDRLNELEAADIAAVAGLIDGERTAAGLAPGEQAVRQAQLITALFRGINLMRALAPDTVGPELLEEALDFVIGGLGVERSA
jgi:AcrR family transcriptional regulator